MAQEWTLGSFHLSTNYDLLAWSEQGEISEAPAWGMKFKGATKNSGIQVNRILIQCFKKSKLVHKVHEEKNKKFK